MEAYSTHVSNIEGSVFPKSEAPSTQLTAHMYQTVQ
jgi:hypothetical protein